MYVYKVVCIEYLDEFRRGKFENQVQITDTYSKLAISFAINCFFINCRIANVIVIHKQCDVLKEIIEYFGGKIKCFC